MHAEQGEVGSGHVSEDTDVSNHFEQFQMDCSYMCYVHNGYCAHAYLNL